MTRLTMKVAGTRTMAAVAIGLTIPKKPKRLIAAIAARTISTVMIARILATSGSSATWGEGGLSSATAVTLIFRGLAP